jgi:hypothetical protein
MTDDLANSDPENQPGLIKQTEDIFFVLERNITQDAKNTIWGFLKLAKESYSSSPHKKEWNTLLQNLQMIIDDFHNDYSAKSELKLTAMHRNALDLKAQEEHDQAE